MGYLAGNKIYCLAKVMKDFTIDWRKSSRLSLFGASIKRFYSNEVAHVKLQVNFLNHTFLAESNKDGVVVIDEEIPIENKEEAVLPISFKILEVPSPKLNYSEKFFQGEILNPGNPKQIIISDIDDTIIHTNVLSKVKMVYNSIMVGFENRKMIAKANEFLHLLSEEKYPIFYVSNSPFNLYEYLRKFLSFNKFQKGPMFLREFREQEPIFPDNYNSHKQFVIEKLLQRFPESKFVLLGDGAEHDPYIYGEMKQKYKDRISEIYLRKIYTKKRHELLAKWRKAFSDPSICIFDHYDELIAKLKSRLNQVNRS